MNNEDLMMSHIPTGNWLPILASSLILDYVSATPEEIERAIQEAKACGFTGTIVNISVSLKVEPNTNGIPAYFEAFAKLLSIATKNDFTVIIYNSYVYDQNFDQVKKELAKLPANASDADKMAVYKRVYDNQIKDFIDLCSKYAAFGGLCFQDEPSYAMLAQQFSPEKCTLKNFETHDKTFKTDSYYSLSNQYKIAKSFLSSDKVLFLNLVGIAEEEHMKDANEKVRKYDEYLKLFLNILKPAENNNTFPYLWCYDMYPIKEKNMLLVNSWPNNSKILLKNNGEITVLYKEMYQDLEAFRYYSKEAEGVFWNYCQSMQYFGGPFLSPLALEQYLRFQIFTSLAMGAQGVLYWTYHQRKMEKPSEGNGNELYLSALINMTQNRTASWYYAQRINAEIRKYNSVFRGATLEEWGHVGSVYAGCRMMTNTIGLIKSIETSGKGVLVTLLSNQSYQYTIVVSHDVENYQNLSLHFVSLSYAVEITPFNNYGALLASPDSTNSTILRTLPPGGYLIFKDTRIHSPFPNITHG